MEENKISKFIKTLRETSIIGGERRKRKMDEEIEKQTSTTNQEKMEDVNKHKWKGQM